MWINTDLPPDEGLKFLGPPSWTSKSFNLLNYLPPEMVSLVVLLDELPLLGLNVKCSSCPFDFSLPDINVGIGSAQKWPSKDDGYF